MVSALGSYGEQVAARHVAELGWTLLDRNWRCGAGELDLVAFDPGPAPSVVAIEVKTRSGTGFGEPIEAITRAKLARLRTLAAEWRRGHASPPGPMRVDAIGVLKLPGLAPVIDHRRGVS